MTDTDRLWIVTGGPGSGKTTLIDALKRTGLEASIEVGRQIIQEQMAIDGRGLPWVDPCLFAELMLSREMQTYHALRAQTGPVICDRGVPDVLGYLRVTGLPAPPHMHAAARTLRYNRRVFIAPPWPEIYAGDRERRQTLEIAERTYEAMVVTYTELGYELMEIPKDSVEQRVDFVLRAIGSSPQPSSR